MKRLLMLSYPFPPNATAGAVRSERFARYLPLHGWEVEVVTIQPRADLFNDQSRLESLGNSVRVHLTATLDPWLRLQSWKPRFFPLRALRSVLERLFSFPDHMLLWLPFAIRAGLQCHRERPIDAIYSTSPPHSTHLAGLVLSRLIKKPWFADFRDPWTLNAYRGNNLIDQALFRVEKGLERAVLRCAHTVLANTPSNRANLLRAFSFLAEDKVVHLPNGWEPFPAHIKLENGNTSGVFSIIHTGTFYPKFRPFGLLYGLAHWLSTAAPELREAVRVRILGARDSETKKVVNELGLNAVVEILPWVSLDEARQAMIEADVLWASLGTGKESATYVPSKLFEYMAAGRPIWGFFPEGDAASLIRATGTGTVFTCDTPEFVASAIKTAVESKQEGSWPHCIELNPAFESYRADAIAGRLSELLKNGSQEGRS